MRARKTVVAVVALSCAVLASGVSPEAALPTGAVVAILLVLATSGRESPTWIPPPPVTAAIFPPVDAWEAAAASQLRTSELERIEYARGVLLEATTRGVIDDPTFRSLVGILAERQARAIAVPLRPAPMPPPPRADSEADARSAAAETEPARASTPPPPGPSAMAVRLRRLREVIASDVAVHGLAYLGVLLLFVGTLGFLLVSFTSVRLGLRPLAEISMPAVLLGSAWFLRRRRAPVVATSLGLLGGSLLPVVLATSFVDGVAFPPELHGTALAFTLACVMLGLAGIYAVYCRREPDASLRYLVAPMTWLAVWAAGLIVAADSEGAIDLRRWSAGQFALVTVAIAATAWVARSRPAHPLAGPTRISTVPGLVVAYTVTIGMAAVAGWPALPVAVAGLATVAAIEALGTASDAARLAQLGVIGLSGSALVPALGPGTTGAVVALAFGFLLERVIREGRAAPLLEVAAAGLTAGLAASISRPAAGLVACGLAAVWSHVRRSIRAGELEPWASLAAGILPVPAAVSLVALVGAGPGFLTLGVGLLAAAVTLRVLRIDDPFYRAWLSAGAGLVAVSTLFAAGDVTAAISAQLAAAAAAAAVTLGLASPIPALGVWGAAASFAWATWLAASALDIAPGGRLVWWSAAGLLGVVTSEAFARRASAAGHVCAAGLTVMVPALILARGDAHLASLATWSAAWALVTILDDVGRSPLGDLFERVVGTRRRLRIALAVLPATVCASSLPFLIVLLGERAGAFDGHRSWKGVALAVLELVYASAARLARRRTTGRAAATAAFAVGVVAIAVAAPAPWPSIEAVAALVASVLVMGRTSRRPLMTWVAWLASGLLGVLLAGRTALPSEELVLVVIGWGAILMVVGLAWDDLRSGRRVPGEGIRAGWLTPPVVLGALATPAGLAVVAGARPSQVGAWALAAGCLYAVVAVQLRAGSIAGASLALLTFATSVLAPRSPMHEPWLFAPWIALLVAGGRVSAWRAPLGRDPWLRWDLPFVVVAHGTAIVALARSVAIDEVSATWGAVALICLGAAALWPARPYLAVGAAIGLVAAGAAGPAWLALAFAAVSAGCVAAAAGSRGWLRAGSQLVAALSAGGAWWELGTWAGWNTSARAVLTAVLGAALVLGAAGILRWTAAERDWSALLATSSIVGGLIAAAVALAPATDRALHLAGSLGALDLAAVALAGALAAGPLGVLWGPRARTASAALSLPVGILAAYGSRVPDATVATAASLAGLGATVATLVLTRRRADAAWRDPLIVLAAASSTLALLAAAGALPRRGPIEAVLGLAGVESAAAGIALRRRWLLALSPVFLCSAWLSFATEALTGDVQWFTIPIGLSLLAIVGVGRGAVVGARRVRASELVVLEYVGMAFLVVGSLVDAIVRSPAHGIAGIAIGASIAAWGAITRVRRRAAFGVVAATVAAAEILAAALLPFARHHTGPFLWVALVVAGVIVLAVATGLERGRERVRSAIGRFETLTEGWE